jgi:hypothetical protein
MLAMEDASIYNRVVKQDISSYWLNMIQAA